MRDYMFASLDEFKEAEKYWLEKLSGELSEVKFYSDFQGINQYTHMDMSKETGEDTPPDKTGNTESLCVVLGNWETNRLLQISKNNDLSLYVVLLACFKILLYKYLGQEDIITAAPIYTLNNRKFNKYVFFRDAVQPGVTFKDLLARIKETVVEGYKNEHFPFKYLIEKLDLREGMSLARVALALENIHQKEFLTDMRQDHENDVSLLLRKNNGLLEAEAIYNPTLFKRESIQKLLDRYQWVLKQVLTDTQLEVSGVQLITQEEKNKILAEFNGTDTDYPADKTIQELFDLQAARTPNRVAVSYMVDLNDIYQDLKSDTVNYHLVEKWKQCNFKKNPFIFMSAIDPTDCGEGNRRPLKILKTQRHTCLVVNQNVVELLNCFDGEINLWRIFSRLREMNLTMYIYPIKFEDLLEITSTFTHHVEEFSISHFEEFVRLIKFLYKNYLIDLKGLCPVDSPGEITAADFDPHEGFDVTALLEDIFNRGERLIKADVLFIGDTPGMPSVGLLYIASYLWRNGIKALCHFNDRNGDYASLEKDIRDLLDKIQPKWVGVSMKWFPYMARVLEICKIVKNHSPEIKIILGGNTASYYWEKVIAYDFVDYVVRGDGEVPFLKICQGADYLPNCVYKKDGKVVANPITYIHNETNSKEVYLSHLDNILISRYASVFGSFFIQTQRGCTLNCCYCGGCKGAQEKTFGRKTIFRRGIEEVRKDIIEVRKYTSLFLFDLIESNEYYLDYFKELCQGIDLSSYFCIFGNYITPSREIITAMCSTFKYVYWELDMASLSQRHRQQMVAKNLVKVQTTDAEIIDFFDACEKYDNNEVRINLIAGLPYFSREDIEESNRMMRKIITRYRCFFDFHWGLVHAQPGAPLAEEAHKHNMHSSAVTYEDYLEFSEMNFDKELPFPCLEDYRYPYVYFNDEELNAAVSRHSAETRGIIAEYREKRMESALVEETLTYSQLNERAHWLAGLIKEKGAKPGSIVALMSESSLEMVVSLLAVLKAGCAYLPIDPTYPEERKKYVLQDTGAKILLTREHLLEAHAALWESVGLQSVIPVDTAAAGTGQIPTPVIHYKTQDPVYVIYTSGTTGKPKGVLVEQGALVNYTCWRLKAYSYTEEDITLQPLSYCFDGFKSNFYSSLLSGGILIMVPETRKMDLAYMKDIIAARKVTNISLVPRMYEVLLDSSVGAELGSLRFVVLGGERAGEPLLRKSKTRYPGLQHIIEYGPTEATVTTAANTIVDENNPAVVGPPIANVQVYILDHTAHWQPVGVVGELHITGVGLARGYINNPELTAEKFVATDEHGRTRTGLNKKLLWGVQRAPRRGEPIKDFFEKSPSGRRRLYKTGDLARWLGDGTLEFLGRLDQQVKVRGYRIELGEIESYLLDHDQVEEAVVVIKEKKGENYFCAYIVPASSSLPGSSATSPSIEVSRLRDYLGEQLPDYMVPSYFVPVEKIPLTSSGKVNQKALPDPGDVDMGGKYIAPRDDMEEKLTAIWAELLDIEKSKISVHANFFALGGHSLKATILMNRIHKSFNVKIPMAELFKVQTVSAMAQYIKKTAEDKYVPLEAVEKKEYYTLSSAQRRLYIQQQLNLQSTHYNIPWVVELEGKSQRERFESTFIALVRRHESFRTSFIRVGGQPVQRISEPHEVEFRMEYHEIEGEHREAIELLINEFMGPFDLSQPPLLKAGLIKVENERHILMVDMHHIISDGLSTGILVKEFMALYNREKLAPIKLQYKDFSEGQNSAGGKRKTSQQQEYWLEVFSGEIPILKLPTDYPRPANYTFKGGTLSFALGTPTAGGIKNLALEEGATLYMILLALYTLLLAKLSGQEDIVVGTAVAGRGHADLQSIIGNFLNMLAIRNHPRGEKTFKKFLGEVINTSLAAFANQDYPFDDLVENLLAQREVNRHPIFDVGFGLQNIEIPEISIPALKLKPYHYQDRTAKVDMTMLGSESKDNVFFTIEYNINLFKKETILRFAEYYKRIAAAVVENPLQKIKDLEIITAEEDKSIRSGKEDDERAIRMDFDI